MNDCGVAVVSHHVYLEFRFIHIHDSTQKLFSQPWNFSPMAPKGIYPLHQQHYCVTSLVTDRPGPTPCVSYTTWKVLLFMFSL